MIYLTQPYYSPNTFETYDHEQNIFAVSELLKMGYSVFNIISQIDQLKSYSGDKPEEIYNFWKPFRLDALSSCDLLAILELNTWTTSKSISDEILHANICGIKIVFLNPNTPEKWEDIINEKIGPHFKAVLPYYLTEPIK